MHGSTLFSVPITLFWPRFNTLVLRSELIIDSKVEALRDAHAYQEGLRNELKVKHGKDFEEFERVVRELDHLNMELHQVSEHAVNLDANFSKYGYSAHLSEHNQSVMLMLSRILKLMH